MTTIESGLMRIQYSLASSEAVMSSFALGYIYTALQTILFGWS